MSQFEQMKNAAEELRSRIEKILSVDRESLYRPKRQGQIDFQKHGKEHFEAVFRLLEKLRWCYLDDIPSSYTEKIIEPLDEYKKVIDDAMSIDRNKGSLAQFMEETTFTDKIEELYPRLVGLAHPIIALGRTDDEIKSKQLLKLLQNSHREAEKQREKVKKESDEILEIARGTAAKTGVSSNAKRYDTAKRKHADIAWVCFCSIIGLLVLLIGSMAITYSNIYYVKKR